jgi:hypothetical protein
VVFTSEEDEEEEVYVPKFRALADTVQEVTTFIFIVTES